MLNNIIVTDDKVLILVALSIFFSGILVFLIVIYNNFYTKARSEYFMNFFYGIQPDDANYKLLKQGINVAVYSFFILFFLYSFKLIKKADDIFPSRKKNIKPFKYFPNVYMEDLVSFTENNIIWLRINLTAFVFLFFLGVFIFIYFIIRN
ncbi:hypothetical protein [Acinetobacter sp. DSM 11652]|uniref:hypothetical protein n=1 Tax=Acinetobacter sp. DSM 11652 TaxID=346222 RepID=UPI00115FF9EC|nr:hypothetical protein [Acinetobacter sp. DSM 11652]